MRLPNAESTLAIPPATWALDVIGLTAFDTAIHTWDVSRAIEFDEQLDDALVEFALDLMNWLRGDPR